MSDVTFNTFDFIFKQFFYFCRLVPRGDQNSGDYWNMVAGLMQSASSFEMLVGVASSVHASMPDIQLNITNVRLDTDPLDHKALHIVPWDVLVRNPFPVDTKGDGRCFLFAAARLLFGYADENRVVELRCRLIIEGIMNRDYYLDHGSMGRGLKGGPLQDDVTASYAAQCGATGDWVDLRDIGTIFNNLLFNYVKPYEVTSWVTLLRCRNISEAAHVGLHCPNLYLFFRKLASGCSTCWQMLPMWWCCQSTHGLVHMLGGIPQ